MSNEITTEILAKSIDKIKKTVQKENKNVRLDIQGKKQDFRIIHKSASNKDNQLNAMAIAPINSDGKADYDNVAVVYAGTNTWGETGRDGFATAGVAYIGGLSEEYYDAERFLTQTKDKLAKHNGTITDVAGFSQSGGYMMKMAAKHGQKSGFRTTSFDDWGQNQISTLTKSEQAWLKENPEALLRYQNDSWADLSNRDHIFGTIQGVIGSGVHGTLANYFDGNFFNLDRLAKAGIFAPNMTKEQVLLAAKNWVRKKAHWKNYENEAVGVKERIKVYLTQYGIYASHSYSKQMIKLKQLRQLLSSSGGGLTRNEKLYLDSEAALMIVEKALSDFQLTTESIVALYQEAIRDAQELWQQTLYEARQMGSLLSEYEIQECLHFAGATQYKMVTEPCTYYQSKLDKIANMTADFTRLVSEIKAKIHEIVQRDQDLAAQLKGGLT